MISERVVFSYLVAESLTLPFLYLACQIWLLLLCKSVYSLLTFYYCFSHNALHIYIYIYIYIMLYIYLCSHICIYIVKKTDKVPSMLLSIRQWLNGNSCTWADDAHDLFHSSFFCRISALCVVWVTSSQLLVNSNLALIRGNTLLMKYSKILWNNWIIDIFRKTLHKKQIKKVFHFPIWI